MTEKLSRVRERATRGTGGEAMTPVQQQIAELRILGDEAARLLKLIDTYLEHFTSARLLHYRPGAIVSALRTELALAEAAKGSATERMRLARSKDDPFDVEIAAKLGITVEALRDRRAQLRRDMAEHEQTPEQVATIMRETP